MNRTEDNHMDNTIALAKKHANDVFSYAIQALVDAVVSLDARVQELERARDADANFRQEQNERNGA